MPSFLSFVSPSSACSNTTTTNGLFHSSLNMPAPSTSQQPPNPSSKHQASVNCRPQHFPLITETAAAPGCYLHDHNCVALGLHSHHPLAHHVPAQGGKGDATDTTAVPVSAGTTQHNTAHMFVSTEPIAPSQSSHNHAHAAVSAGSLSSLMAPQNRRA